MISLEKHIWKWFFSGSGQRRMFGQPPKCSVFMYFCIIAYIVLLWYVKFLSVGINSYWCVNLSIQFLTTITVLITIIAKRAYVEEMEEVATGDKQLRKEQLGCVCISVTSGTPIMKSRAIVVVLVKWATYGWRAFYAKFSNYGREPHAFFNKRETPVSPPSQSYAINWIYLSGQSTKYPSSNMKMHCGHWGANLDPFKYTYVIQINN